jgi:RNA polymerase sigma-70 factor, ECF subfamily
LINISTDKIIRCQNGDATAFKQIYEETNNFVYSLAIRLLWQHEEAKDVVQESYIRVWKNIHKYNVELKFTTWLYKIVTNLCYDQLKKRKRKSKIFEQTNNNTEILSKEDIRKHYEDNETISRIAALSSQLTPKQKVVFVLRDLQDLDMDDVIRISGLSSGSVKSNLYLARKNIRKKLEYENEM